MYVFPIPDNARSAPTADRWRLGITPTLFLAWQVPVAYHAKRPDSLSYEESWATEAPVISMGTHSPALVGVPREGGQERTCRLLLANAYRVTAKGAIRRRHRPNRPGVDILISGTPGRLPRDADMQCVSRMPGTGVAARGRTGDDAVCGATGVA
ncbi:MAG: hypothetical protein QF785_12280 [Phycisphaeraceae bacterium]|nr:hypothetical protein [Phycisphaeraceae bacterium]MDP7348225.1 hypothetical protein [Phycisphaeraceae bacterium]